MLIFKLPCNVSSALAMASEQSLPVPGTPVTQHQPLELLWIWAVLQSSCSNTVSHNWHSGSVGFAVSSSVLLFSSSSPSSVSIFSSVPLRKCFGPLTPRTARRSDNGTDVMEGYKNNMFF